MRTLVGKRKRGTNDSLTTPLFSGVLSVDAAGRASVVAFTNNETDILRGDGTFGPSSGGTSVVPLLIEGTPPQIVGDGAGKAVLVNFS